MTAGDLRERVIFAKRPATVPDQYGNQEDSFQDQFTLYARIRPVKGRITSFLGEESVEAQRLTAIQPVVIMVRVSLNSTLVTTAWRATSVRTGVIYNILSIANTDEKNAYLEMLCQSGVAT